MDDERLTIDELARRAGMTTRNVRAHQTRGLLPPPTLVGRIGYYGRLHLERLELIHQLQEAGLNLSAVAWLLGTGGGGDDPARAAFREAVLEPFTEDAVNVQRADFEARLGGPLPPKVVERAVELGVVEPVDKGTLRVLLPRVVRRAEDLVALGIPVEDQLEVLAEITGHVQAVAKAFVGLAVHHLASSLTARLDTGGAEDVEATIGQLRGIADEVVLGLMQRATTEELHKVLAEGAKPRPRRGPKARARRQG
jgi:DNA-binding transcriptional MerR regulator